jgi:hypothetical protein
MRGQDVIVIIDYGSYSNFVSAVLAIYLAGVPKLDREVRFKVASGGILVIQKFITISEHANGILSPLL